MMADYNGWADQREEEREALDQLEMTPIAVCGAGVLTRRGWHQSPGFGNLEPFTRARVMGRRSVLA